MDYEDIIPEGLEDKTEQERLEIIERWDYLHDLKEDILAGKETGGDERRISRIDAELDELSKLLTPREAVPESGILTRGRRKYILCPRCGTFVHLTRKRVDEVILALEERAEKEAQSHEGGYLIRSINCPVCRWGLGIPEGF